MSSILEALERAEEERLRGEGAVLRPLPSAPRRRRLSGPKPVLILALVLVLLLNLAYWLFQRQSATEAPVAPPPAQRELPAAVEDGIERPAAASQPALSVREQLKRHTPPSSKPLISEAVVASPPQPAAQPAPKAVEPEAVPVAMPPSDGLETKTEVSPVPAPSPAPVEPELPAQARPLPRRVTPPPEPVALAPTAEPTPTPPPLSPPAQNAAASPARPAAQEQIPLVWELPQYLREKILQLKSSVHVYSENPSQRFVIINMHRYGEGDTLPPDGFRLKRIERDGIIIDYGEGLARLEQR